MARGKQESNVIFFKVAYENNDKDAGKPFFAEQVKKGDSWVDSGDDTFLEGRVIGIEKGSYEYKKGKKTLTQNTFKLKLDGGGETYVIGFNYNYYSRNILNTIAAIDDLGSAVVKMSVYRNKDGFVSIYTTVNGEKTDWAIDAKKLPSNEDDKWEASFDHFIDTISANIPAKVDGLGGSFDDAVDSVAAEMRAHTEAANRRASKDDVVVDDPQDLPF